MSEQIWQIRTRGQKWFAESAPQNWVGAKVTLGSGDNGTVTVEHDTMVTPDTVEKIEVVVPTTPQVAAAASYANNKITVTLAANAAYTVLGTGADGTLTLTHDNTTTTDTVEVVVSDPESASASVDYTDGALVITLAANTGSSNLAANAVGALETLINALVDCPITAVASGAKSGRITAAVTEAAMTAGSKDLAANAASAISDALEDLGSPVKSVSASGTGATRITAAVSAKVFATAGHLGTPCRDENVVIPDASVEGKFYICRVPNGTTKNEGWETFTLAAV